MSRSTKMFALFLIAVTATAASAQAPNCTTNEADVACTQQGAVRGVAEGDLVAFKGIPYARAHRTAALEADAGCRGPVGRARRQPIRGNLSANHRAAGFGGLTYSGETLVPQGVVFVSYNPRLGVLGFLAHPALDAERPEKISGNYGSLDQIAMLRWLKANIAAFGGDPNKIFLFGTSAGGGNICALITSPLTRGLIHGVAMQSSVPMGCEIQTLTTPAKAPA